LKRIRVLIADDHPILRSGIASLLSSQPDMEIAGEAGSVPEVLNRAIQLRPDVVVLDLSMPGGGGLKALPEIRRECPDARVVVLTIHDDQPYLLSALAAGASGYLLKSADFGELRSAIRAVHGGRTYISVPVGPGPEKAAAQKPANAAIVAKELSQRERQILRLLALGHTYRSIAEQLHLSERSVETYRSRLVAKLGLPSRAALVRYALSSGMLDEAP
jgi:two-component system, NarL family, response regulator NreC